MNRRIIVIIIALVMISIFAVGCLNFISTASQQSTFTSTSDITKPDSASHTATTSIDSVTITDTPLPSSTKAPTNTPSATSEVPVATAPPTPTITTAPPTPTITTAPPTPTITIAPPTPTILEGEFIVVNEYNVTSISYYRAILVNGDEIILLTCPGKVYDMFYDLDTGLKTIMKFYVTNWSCSTKLDSRQYASLTSLQEVYLPDANKNVYIGRTGYNISVKGMMTGAFYPSLKGLPVFEISECYRIS